MRALIIVAGASLCLSACGDKAATQSDANVSGNLAAVEISSNDTTVIDAATGDAANMAADVAYDEGDLTDTGDVRSDGKADGQSMTRRKTSEKRAAPADNSVSDSPAENAVETNSN